MHKDVAGKSEIVVTVIFVIVKQAMSGRQNVEVADQRAAARRKIIAVAYLPVFIAIEMYRKLYNRRVGESCCVVNEVWYRSQQSPSFQRFKQQSPTASFGSSLA
jgi:hypothetical protein